MRDRIASLLVAAALGCALLPNAAHGAEAPAGSVVYIAETGHNLGAGFRTYAAEHGGLPVFGYPITEVLREGDARVQYFERARIELRSHGVSLGRIGAELVAERGDEAPFRWIDRDPGGARRYYAASGHTLGGRFADYWDAHGGLGLFGYPISEEFREPDAAGTERMVQYFERARFEWHPDIGPSGAVLQGLIGSELVARRSDAAHITAPAAPLALLGSATTIFRTSAAERRFNIERAATMFDGLIVDSGTEFSFLANGDFSDDAGFVEGYGIVGGRLERVIGGGLCQVSTTMFRAVSNAGLHVTRRIPHSYIVYFYENILGFDATVYSPGVDFRWVNDMSTPVFIVARTNTANAAVTFEVWGTDDGRRVSYAGPDVSNIVEPGVAVWQYDPRLPAGATRQLVHGRPGMTVRYQRSVTRADGTVEKTEYRTRYQPWDDFFTYGPGVTPPAGVVVVTTPVAVP